MRRILPLLTISLALVLGCRAGNGQIPANPTTYSCATPNGTNYVELNQASPASGLSYTDSKPAAGVYCYIAQSVISSTGQISIASNVSGPVTLDGVKSTFLTWSAPTTGPTPTGYVLSRAPAVASTIGAPAINSPTVAQNESPTPQPDIKLVAMVR